MTPRSEQALTDDRLVVLASQRRRLTVSHIDDCGGEVSLAELSRRIAATEADLPVEAVEEAAVIEVSDTLYITHLPVLIEHDVVEYDYDDGVIRATDRLEELAEEIEDPDNDRRRWSLYYGIPAVVLSIAAIGLNFYFTGESPAAVSVVALIGVAILLLVSLLKYTDSRSLLLSK
jgi:hypothetical protein